MVAMTIDTDGAARQTLVQLLRGGWAHLPVKKAFEGIPEQLRGVQFGNHPHTLWQLLEHLRIAQRDILEYSRRPDHVSPPFPDGYWPREASPPTVEAWDESRAAFQADLKSMMELLEDPSNDLLAPFSWSPKRHTLFREALVLADHNAYHTGQAVQLRKALGCDVG